MKTLRQLLESSKPHKAVAENGIALRNHLVDKFKGTKLKSYSPSNPYADYKTSSLSIPRSMTTELKKYLEGHGWKSNTDYFNVDAKKAGIFRMIHPINTNTTLIVSPQSDPSNVVIYSSKKAKRSDLPFYD